MKAAAPHSVGPPAPRKELSINIEIKQHTIFEITVLSLAAVFTLKEFLLHPFEKE